ncbi:MAG: hypothetical protein AAFW01_12570 [Pseudomonadota bacterium]
MPGRIERKTRESLEKRDHFAGILPLAQPFEPDLESIVERAQRLVAPAGAKVLLHPMMRKLEQASEGSIFSFGASEPTRTRMIFLVIDHVGVWIAAREGQLEHRGDLSRWPNPSAWPGGAMELARHTAWLEVVDLGFMRDRGIARLDRAFNRAAAVTAALAAVAGQVDPLGILWWPAQNAIGPDRFAAQVERVLGGEAPLELWLRWFYTKPLNEGDEDGILTRGLLSFTGFEIEVPPGPIEPELARAIVFEFARMVIDHGTEPRTGMVVALSGRRTATIRLGDSLTRPGLPVCELTVTEKLGSVSARSTTRPAAAPAQSAIRVGARR